MTRINRYIDLYIVLYLPSHVDNDDCKKNAAKENA